MKKRIIAIAVMVVMTLSVFAFAGCDGFSLAKYRADGRTTIQNHANVKMAENGYTAAGLQAIARAVADGQEAVDVAESKTAVDTAITTAKAEINAVIPKLTAELESRIKADYLQEYGHEFYFGSFYGLYNGAAVFFVPGVQDWVKVVTISGVVFGYHTGWTILVWKDGVFYDLENIEPIFETSILTQSDLIKIAAIHANGNKEFEMNEVNFVIGYENMSTSFSKNSFLEQIANSLEEWTLIYNQNCPNELIEKYNEQFFADNSLIVYAFMKGTSGNQIEITKISKKAKELCVEVDVSLGIMEAVSQGIFIIEIAKSEIVGANTIRVIEK